MPMLLFLSIHDVVNAAHACCCCFRCCRSAVVVVVVVINVVNVKVNVKLC